MKYLNAARSSRIKRIGLAILTIALLGSGPRRELPAHVPLLDRKLYGPVSGDRYLTGRFNPPRHPDFIGLSRLGIPVSRRHYLRRDAARALARLYRAFRKEHPRVRFVIVSSTRSFYSQKRIWERKWKGKTRVEGKYLPRTHRDPYRRGLFILRYSSMPGTSRHHWGTDVDITNFNNGYFEKGQGATLFRWLEKNAGRFGFCRPYTAGRKRGYQEEKWHWSYRPLSRIFLSEWNRRFAKRSRRLLRRGKFAGIRSLHRLAPVYVNSVNPDCK